MAAITVNTNGQTLQVNASVSHWTTAALAVTASSSDDVESTTTTTISSAYTMHFSNTATTALVTVKQVDGTVLLSQTFNVEAGTGQRTLNPLPDAVALAAPTFFESEAYQGGREFFPRYLTDSATSAGGMTSQVMRLTFFTAQATESIASIAYMTGTTAAAATPSLIRYGLYTVASSGDIALVASTVHDAALLVAQGTVYPKALSSPYTVTAGVRYASGILVVTAATAPTMLGKGTIHSNMAALAPRMASGITGQADLPASVTNANINTLGSGAALWGALVPA